MAGLTFDVLIVGGGHGGAQVAIALRQAQFEGSVAIIGDEPDFPYERPPLSKEYLAGEKEWERLLIRSEAFWSERAVTMILGERVVALDPEARVVLTAGGERIGYRRLVWAAGGKPRTMSCAGADLAGVHTLRTRADADRMKAELAGARCAVVIGGGYIGLEAAAVLSSRGIAVCLLEAQDRVLARVAGEPLSRFYETEHRAQGVELRLNAAVDCLVGSGPVSGVRMADGEVIPADLVVVGIGIVPSVEPLLAAGAAGGNGVAVDAQCRTSLPDVFAVGDCALHANRYAGGAMVRIESVQNAVDQANVVAKMLTGGEAAYEAVPWFWSNQYDLRLQTVGLSAGHDMAVLRGEPAGRSFSILYLKEGRVIALDCVNATKDYVQGRKLITDGAPIDPERLVDASTPLKQLLAEACPA